MTAEKSAGLYGQGMPAEGLRCVPLLKGEARRAAKIKI